MAHIPVALEIYTVRGALARDYRGTLEKVKQVGYDYIELPGAPPFDAAQFNKVLGEIGLTVVGVHVALDQLEGSLDHWVDFANAIGTKDLICPALPESRCRTKNDWLAMAALLEDLGDRCKQKSLFLSYHNHSFEFVQFDGTYALDLLYSKTSPDRVHAELDTYWVKHGGCDPVEYINRYANRLRILHIKDMGADERRSFAEIGSGTLDWKAIHAASLKAGVKVYCVEQDRCPGDPFDSVRKSIEFLRKLQGK
jgi:sugar phosphate isomerase/epimerase